MTRRSWIPSLILGLAACALSGCRTWPLCGPAALVKDADKSAASNAPPPYHPQTPPAQPISGPPNHVAPARLTVDPPVKIDDPPPPPAPPPPLPDAPVLQVGKPPEDPPIVTALRDLLQNRSPEAMERLRAYDGASRELLLTLLPLAARVGDGGLDRATPQETAVLLDQVRDVETVLRPRAALTLDKVCFCRQIHGFGDCEPWPADHVFQSETDDHRGERIQVYAEVRNFTCRPHGPFYETSLAGEVEIRDFNKGLAARLDFPATVERSLTPRQDYFVNFQFPLPRLPEGRYTLRVLVKDMLAPPAMDGAPRAAGRSLDFSVGGAGLAHAGPP
ncbi:MAG TPA: hypothetical protein VMS17_27775 [Gemmataceae bacterium]|nr:hypothetical protein [Gemmataceae bacterium]